MTGPALVAAKLLSMPVSTSRKASSCSCEQHICQHLQAGPLCETAQLQASS